MVSTILSKTSASGIVVDATAPRPVVFDAELAKRQSELAEYAKHDSSKTTVGQARIDALNARIAAIKAQMHKAARAEDEPAGPQTVHSGLTPLGNLLDATV